MSLKSRLGELHLGEDWPGQSHVTEVQTRSTIGRRGLARPVICHWRPTGRTTGKRGLIRSVECYCSRLKELQTEKIDFACDMSLKSRLGDLQVGEGCIKGLSSEFDMGALQHHAICIFSKNNHVAMKNLENYPPFCKLWKTAQCKLMQILYNRLVTFKTRCYFLWQVCNRLKGTVQRKQRGIKLYISRFVLLRAVVALL